MGNDKKKWLRDKKAKRHGFQEEKSQYEQTRNANVSEKVPLHGRLVWEDFFTDNREKVQEATFSRAWETE